MLQQAKSISKSVCYHCGEYCDGHAVKTADKVFCCEGCKMVYQILNQSGLCDYYAISENPGTNQKIKVREGKFAFLDDEKIANILTSFKDEEQAHITFYLPQIHCSSCLWLLENLHRINKDIISSRVNFERKEVALIFNYKAVSLREVAEILTSIGYEPHISLQQMKQQKTSFNRAIIYKLGIAGFCFANIMMMSFPEYFGIDASERSLQLTFRSLNLLLSLPVFFYAASEFYISAWKSLKHGFLNIDTPIVLAILITFSRSVYEIASGTGAGYLDSMSGIVFFMLAGRVLQNKTYAHLNFERDFTSYFPIAVSRIENGNETTLPLPDIKLNDTLLIHNNEIIPADGIITRGKAFIDYSFVTGESDPVEKQMGEIVYAGGRQTAGNIEILVIKEVMQSYLTDLWNRSDLKSKERENENSFVHGLSRWFTWILFSIALAAATYWYYHDSSKIANVVTAVLIVACPCALYLSNTFTNGNILRKLAKNKLYLRNATVIEAIAGTTHIVFDKTGTLTEAHKITLSYHGKFPDRHTNACIGALAAQSAHPLSKAIAWDLATEDELVVDKFKEYEGAGIEGIVDEKNIALGSAAFIKSKTGFTVPQKDGVFVAVNNSYMGRFSFSHQYRKNLVELLNVLNNKFPLTLLSGDNDTEHENLQQMFGPTASLYFRQSPEDKLRRIKHLQQKGYKVLMIGDGLNDAGALLQADAGIALTENSNNFTPACDGIMEANKLQMLYKFIKLTKANRKIIMSAFVVSVIYNIVGLSFATSGQLSPLVAAILMPSSSLSILLITYGFSNVITNWYGLKEH